MAAATAPMAGPIVHTDCGPVEGVDEGLLGKAFLGVPYASAQRWTRSKLLSEGGGCWNSTLRATSTGPNCPQWDWSASGWEGEEECLTLNVYTPLKLHDPAPVIVEIHGGSLVSGGPGYWAALKSQHVVFVAINYRLNVLGFLALKELSSADPFGVSGNYGYSDQITALRWVQANIARFGGDPRRVTVTGCSSGGSSVWDLLSAPSARGLFRAAFPLSAASRNNVTLEQAQRDNSVFMTHTRCTTVSCLRSLNLSQVMRADQLMNTRFPFFDHPWDFELPYDRREHSAGVCIVDGVVITHKLHDALDNASLHAQVPVLAGSNAQEGDSSLMPASGSVADYEAAVQTFLRGVNNSNGVILPADAKARLLALYNVSSPEWKGSPKATLDAMDADLRVVCGVNDNVRRLARSRAAATRAPPAEVPVWHAYADAHSTAAARSGHCHMVSALSQPDECSKGGPCTETDRRFRANVLHVTMEFVNTMRPPKPFRRIADVERGSFERGAFALNELSATPLGVSESRLKRRCDFWRETGVLASYAWDE